MLNLRISLIILLGRRRHEGNFENKSNLKSKKTVIYYRLFCTEVLHECSTEVESVFHFIVKKVASGAWRVIFHATLTWYSRRWSGKSPKHGRYYIFVLRPLTVNPDPWAGLAAAKGTPCVLSSTVSFSSSWNCAVKNSPVALRTGVPN